MSALAAYQPSAVQASVAVKQASGSPDPSAELESALAELGILRAEMAALQAALAVLKGSKHAKSSLVAMQQMQASMLVPFFAHNVLTVLSLLQHMACAL